MADRIHIKVWKWALTVAGALAVAFASAILMGVMCHALGFPFDSEKAFRFFSGFAAGLVAAKSMKGDE